MRYSPKRNQTNVNITDQFPLKELLVLLMGFLGIFIAAYIILGLAVELVIPRVDLKTENQLMRLMSSSVNQSSGEVGIPIAVKEKNNRLLEQVLNKLIANCAQPLPEIRIKYVNDDAVNAYAHIDGTIQVHSALLNKVETENELAFIVAHEIGHYANKDNLKALGRRLVLLFMGTTLLEADNGLNKLVLNTLGATENRFSQVQEERADKFAIDLLNKTYGHVGGATSSFRKILASNQPEVLSVFSTHPNPNKRAETLASEINLKGYKVYSQVKLQRL